MDRVYVETSAINQVINDLKSTQEFETLLTSYDYHPVVGIHVIYELARTFLGTDSVDKGKQLFSIIRDIKKSFMPTTEMLLEQEIIMLRTGAAVLPILNNENQISTSYEIEKLAKGLTQTAEEFIGKRENDRRANEKIQNNEYLEHVRNVNANKNGEYRNIRTFADVLGYFEDNIPTLIRGILKEKVSESRELSQRIDSYKSLRSVVRANLYLSFIIIRNEVTPAYDKVDDFRHLIDASYCDGFLTNDGQLSRIANYINPDIYIINWDSLLRERDG